MALHVALLEATPAPIVGAIARACANADASLHLIGPLEFERDDPGLVKAGPKDWSKLDWWLHPGWRDFRDAMARERCLYFAVDAERDAEEAPFRANSVLVVGGENGELPERIREKYPHRIYRLPQRPRKRKFDLSDSVALLLEVGAKGAAARAQAAAEPATPKPTRYGRGRGRRA
jgi:tRNA (cytidine/uridine-2'-O-)-methyltransferase